MRHQLSGRALGRNTAQRQALFRQLLTQLIEHERIVTTEAKCKTIRPHIEKLITLAKKDTVHARRIAFAKLNSRKAVEKLFTTTSARFQERPGGYTRILKIGPRLGDAAPMAIIELVDREGA